MKTLYLSAEELNMLDALRRKSEETYFHSRNVSKLAVALGISCRLSWEAIQILRMGGLLHDVGKLKVPSAILNKKGSLNTDEMREMRRHSAYGEMLLRGTAGVRDESVLNIVRHHHEKIGGKGYPDGFPENHLLVQIVTVADIYDALRSDRAMTGKKSLPSYMPTTELTAGLLTGCIPFQARHCGTHRDLIKMYSKL